MFLDIGAVVVVVVVDVVVAYSIAEFIVDIFIVVVVHFR
jgi:hypothetical protein